jgi:hypothetical protein
MRSISLASVITVAKSIVTLNVAQGGSGSPGGNGFGGGAFNDEESTLTFEKSAVTLNRAFGAESGGEGVGGGVYNLGTLIVDALTLIRKNRASTSNDNIFG